MIERALHAIRSKVVYTLNGKTREISGVHTFDVNTAADVRSPGVSIAGDGSVIVDAAGDEDTAKIHVTVGVDTDPPDPTASGADATITGRRGSADTGVDLEMGETAHVKVRGENHAGELAPASTIKQAKTGRGVGGSTKTIRITAPTMSMRDPAEPIRFTNDGEAQPTGGSLDVFHTGVAAVTLPVGATIQGFAFHGYHETTSDLVQASLVRMPDEGEVIGVAFLDLDSSVTGEYATVSDTSFAQTVAEGDQFALFGSMRPVTERQACRIRWFELTYSVTNLAQTL